MAQKESIDMFGTGMRRIGPWFGGLEREIQRLNRDIDRALPGQGSAGDFPRINIWRDGQGIVLTTEIAGVSPDEFEISIKGNALTLGVERKPVEPAPKNRERWSGRMTRTVELPFAVETGQVTAKFAEGVLYLRLPEAEAGKAIRITVN